MIRNYIKIAWRNLQKNKIVFGINILGLSIGIASCLLIVLFVMDELSYDSYNEKVTRIARVVFRANINGEEMKEAVVMSPVGKALKNDFPEVVDATRLTNLINPKINYKNTTFRDSKFAYVDPNFFEIFTLPIIKGNTTNPLEKPNTVVLTKKEAQKYFGAENPIGKTLQLENYNTHFLVTALIDEVPENTHFHFDMFASTVGYDKAKSNSWTSSEFFTYVLLEEEIPFEVVEAKIPTLLKKYMGAQLEEEIGISYEAFTESNKIGLFLQPLTDIHLKSDFSSSSEIEEGGDIKYVYIFSLIAIFILLIACVNFMNLSTATASKRAKEIGIRKTLGSSKKQLIIQFLCESFIATLVSTVIAIGVVIALMPAFNAFSGKHLSILSFLNPMAFLLLLLFVVIISFLTGAYPALYLSSIRTIQVLKRGFSSRGANKKVRSGLVVFQFMISAGLILATLVVYQQMEYIQNKKIGYEKDHLLVLRDAYLLGKNQEAFKHQLREYSEVINIAQSGFVPAGDSNNSMSGIFKNDTFLRRMFTYDIDENYIATLGMEIKEGRNFSSEFGLEKNNVIVNETAVKILGYEDNPIGKTFQKDTSKGKQTLTIIGVVKDFIFKTLHQKIQPLVMHYNSNGGLIIKAKGKDMSRLIAQANTLWLSFNTNEPFNYSILDDSYKKAYAPERKMGTILFLFAFLTIFIASLGLFGLVTFTAEQKTKEIGIRKVLGSSVLQIVFLLTKEFVKLLFIAFVVALPIGYFLMNQWLNDFAFRIQISPWSLVIVAIITSIMALITISFKTISVAIANPINSLKTE